ncbi:cytochrome c oxidase assembly protein [Devosia sp. YIM 151766]|uniref:cytochrome c oxidase assembly protein n=1 Tax=Devosia sp. YIM 151766 TaxID=3017325 RepID=UPI00255D0B2B|nr:cytochrome c oxidase assembly protein [Devosia sp. YIM 151766]WIY53365.1 cytochrome c oxidase assembly protein [Devosia sp. YIM 151766]
MDPASAFSFDMSYCGPPPTGDELWSRWNFEPVLLIVLALAALWGLLALRGAARSRQAAFAGAWIMASALFISPLCALSVALFSARVGHHVLLTMVVAPLLAWALPAAWGRRPRLLPALIVSTLALWLWHTPDLYAAAFSHPALYWAMQASLIASFAWLWLGLLRSGAPMSAGVVALSSAIQMGLLGALLVFAPAPLYLPHFGTTLAFGLASLDDQQLGGLIMWVPANLPLLALVLWRLLDALGPRREAAG